MNKRTWSSVDLDALQHNFKLAQNLGVRVMPVIKADAYGHGAVVCAKALGEVGADVFAVASLDEALELRRAGIKSDILILGYTDPDNFETLIREEIIQTVMSVEYAQLLSASAKNQKARVHIKLDTGMARLGLSARRMGECESCAADIVSICRMSGLSVEGVFTHFAVADMPEQAFTQEQAECFVRAVTLAQEAGAVLPIRHCANSGAIINYPSLRWDMVRQGIMLYGEKPDDSCPDVDLRPVMTVKSTVAACSILRKGETVSYGRTYTAEKDVPIAVISIGYADGYLRALSNRGWVSIKGHRCPIVGRVCMDQMMVDISACPDIKPGQEVSVIGGDGPSFSELAHMCGTINYELLCAISARVPRVYVRDGKIVEVCSRISQ